MIICAEGGILLSLPFKLAGCYFSGWEDVNIVTMGLLHIPFVIRLYLSFCSRFHLEQ